MKLTLNTGTSANRVELAVHSLATIRSVYMAPLGSPVLPDVYKIIASRSSVSPVYTGSGGSWRPRSTTSSTVVDGHRHAGLVQARAARSKFSRCSSTSGW